MDYDKFIAIVKDASHNQKRVTLYFSHPTSIMINGCWKKNISKITLRFFEFGEGNLIGYGYKKRSDATSGYNIKSLDYFLVSKVSYPDDDVDDEHQRSLFKKWVLRNLDDDVWPDMENSIDNLIANRSNKELTRTYLKSYFNQYELEVIKEMFDSRKDGRVHAGMSDKIFVELSKRKDGYYAWLVVNERSSMLINPNVAILHSRQKGTHYANNGTAKRKC